MKDLNVSIITYDAKWKLASDQQPDGFMIFPLSLTRPTPACRPWEIPRMGCLGLFLRRHMVSEVLSLPRSKIERWKKEIKSLGASPISGKTWTRRAHSPSRTEEAMWRVGPAEILRMETWSWGKGDFFYLSVPQSFCNWLTHGMFSWKVWWLKLLKL